ncbi:MAG: hypothetical protein Tsb0032_23330 [Kiloniellaceae bacterium]
MARSRYATILCCFIGVAGCSFSGEIADHAIAYNKTIEQSENEMLLLNILRASNQQPMHFTRISQISGALEISGNSSLNAPFGGDADSTFLSSFGISGSSKPTYTMQMLNTKEFYNGFLKPVDHDTFALFVAAGWPMRTLVNTLVEEVEIYVEPFPSPSGSPPPGPAAPESAPPQTTPPGGAATENSGPVPPLPFSCRIFANPDHTKESPPNKQYYPQKAINLLIPLLNKSRSARSDTSVQKFGVPLPIASISDVAGVADLKNAGLEPAAVTDAAGNRDEGAADKFQLISSSKSLSFSSGSLDEGADKEAFQKRAKGAFAKGPLKLCIYEEGVIDFLEKLPARLDEGKYRYIANLKLRSAQGILYAFGEMLNFRRTASAALVANVNPDELGFFRVETGTSAPAGAISTRLNDQAYWVPLSSDESGTGFDIGRESNRMLALAQLVLSLNTSSEDLPTTQTIRFIQ